MNNSWRPLLIALTFAVVAKPVAAQPHVHVADADRGMVVSDTATASVIGQTVLRQGGNAVDAAVATAFALAVTWPEAGNIGGGGFMMIRPVDGDPVCIDYRETAPAAAGENTFQPGDGYFNCKVVGVPGTVRGLALAHQRYGQLRWRDLVLPAVRLAKDGFSVDRFLAGSLNHVIAQVGDAHEFAELRRVYGKPGGGPWKTGDVLFLPDLAETLSRIAESGPDAFYRGHLAKLLLDEMQRGNGLISQADLDTYRAKVRPPVRGTFHGYEILGAPPPSSGGTCLIETLNILEALHLDEQKRFSAQTIHLIAEASQRAFLDRARYLGDPDFVDIPRKLISKPYARELAAKISVDRATPSAALAPEIKLAEESPDTTHFSIVDGQGMAVSNTYTLEASWGSRIVVQGAGYLLNNEMGDFNWFPGVTTRAGRIGTSANLVAPGKRMLSSQCPVIITKDGHVALVTGSPGGRTIINTVCNVVLNVTHFGMEVPAAVRAPRMHHQWFPDRIDLEQRDRAPHASVVKKLQAMGHEVGSRTIQGSAHTIGWDPKRRQYVGVADFRRGGRPSGDSAETCGVWNFNDRRRTPLPEARVDAGLSSTWSDNLMGASVDGAGHYRIQQAAGGGKRKVLLDLRTERAVAASVRLKVNAIAFGGPQKHEQLRLSWTDDQSAVVPLAEMVIERTDADRLVLRGMASTDKDKREPYLLSRTPKLHEPITFQLELDTENRRFHVHVRRGSTTSWHEVADGPLESQRRLGYLMLETRNDWSDADDFVAVDRIEIRRRKR